MNHQEFYEDNSEKKHRVAPESAVMIDCFTISIYIR